MIIPPDLMQKHEKTHRSSKQEKIQSTTRRYSRWLKPNESWVTKTNSGLIWFLLWCVVLWNSYIHNILRDFWSLASSSFSSFSSLFSSSFDSLMDIFPSTFSLLPKLRFMSLESSLSSWAELLLHFPQQRKSKLSKVSIFDGWASFGHEFRFATPLWASPL